MAPFRRTYYWRNWRWPRRRRNRFYKRRFRSTIQRRKRRRRRVRRKRFFKNKFKKLKRIHIDQWQPSTVKKCQIKGYLCLFQSGKGRFWNNYCLSKESYVPPHTPGGGGWSFQQLSLGNLYTQKCEFMNIWTRSNRSLNLCRYYGTKVTLYREQNVDYVFTWFKETPRTVEKYFFCSHHPLRLLTHNRRVIVPSFQTQPHKRKPFKTIFIPPPPLLKNQWFFQQHLAPFPLVTFLASAVSLTGMFGSRNSINNNALIWNLDTIFFKKPNFQYVRTTEPQFGYQPDPQYYLWALPAGKEQFNQNKIADSIYLGNSHLNQAGDHIPSTAASIQNYNKGSWGNPFWWQYTTLQVRLFQTPASTQTQGHDLNNWLTKKNQNLNDSWELTKPYINTIRYNPYKDKGDGNEVYFIPNYDPKQTDWNPTNDPSIHFSGFPLWMMLWGIEDILNKMGKCPKLDEDWICVIRTKYMFPPEKQYVLLSYNFVHGTGPYDTERENIAPLDEVTWYPKFKFQREALDAIIQTGPAVCRADDVKNIQAKIKYKSFFKFGGNPPPNEIPTDPTTQPITPTPGGFDIQNEIINPATSIQSMLYQWDFRRDYITPKAAERIKTSETYEQSMFTDGVQTSTDVHLYKAPETQTEETPETQETTLLLQLQQLQQYNLQLQHRFRQLKQSLMDL
nr:MAG: hypothetical protein [Betatorquevirus sp.]